MVLYGLLEISMVLTQAVYEDLKLGGEGIK